MTNRRVRVDVDSALFEIGPEDMGAPDYDYPDSLDGVVLLPATDNKSLVVITGIATGPVWVEVRSGAPEGAGWEHDEVVMLIAEPLFIQGWYGIVSYGGTGGSLFTPGTPGLYRVEVHARNRELHPDESLSARKSERERYVLVFTLIEAGVSDEKATVNQATLPDASSAGWALSSSHPGAILVDVNARRCVVAPFDLHSETRTWPDFGVSAERLLGIDGERLAVRTREDAGFVSVEAQEAPPAGVGWAHDQADLPIWEPLYVHLLGSGYTTLFVPATPGLHRVDVYAKRGEGGLNPPTLTGAREPDHIVFVFTPTGELIGEAHDRPVLVFRQRPHGRGQEQ